MMEWYREKAVQALLHGHGCANELRQRLRDPSLSQGSASSDKDLSKTILDCFSDAISVLIHTTSSDESMHEFSQTISSSSSPHPSLKSQKGSPKKRKASTTEEKVNNLRDDSPAPIYYDGFLWRKYGQKRIKDSNHQRSYYRCAYMDEHNCDAKKQVQKIQDDPPVFRTTYFGNHTCPNHQVESFPVVLDPADGFEGARMIKFGELDQEINSDCPVSVNHREIVKEEVTEYLVNQEQEQHMKEDQSSPLDYHPPPSSPAGDDMFGSSLFLDCPDLLDGFEYGPLDHFDFGDL